jgi:hypothetical protein
VPVPEGVTSDSLNEETGPELVFDELLREDGLRDDEAAPLRGLLPGVEEGRLLGMPPGESLLRCSGRESAGRMGPQGVQELGTGGFLLGMNKKWRA